MDNSVIEKKFKKIGTKELKAKLERKTLSVLETGIVEAIIKSRESGESYISPTFKEESKQTMKEIAEKQTEAEEKVSPKTEKKTTSRSVLSEEDFQRIKTIVDKFEGSKKELVFHLFDQGFTKQQLDKYRPEIAHWSYIYSMAKELGK
jgi:hypothetical protein